MADRIEKICKNFFTRYLTNQDKKIDLKWKDLSINNEDPPDFKLKLNDKDYAVEISQFEVKNKSVTGERINELTYMHSMDRFVEEIREKAINSGYLRGTYVVTFYKSISNFSAKKTTIRNKLVRYIKNTKDFASYEALDIRENNIKVCEIKKYNNKSDMVEPIFVGPFRWIFSPRHLDRVHKMFKKVILTKKEKLESENIKEPKILILFNSYPLADKRVYIKIIDDYKIKELDYYNSIFIVENNKNGYLIYPRNCIE